MIKIIKAFAIIFCTNLFYVISSSASQLSCSVNGTIVLFVPGALRTQDVKDNEDSLFELINKQQKIDLKKQDIINLPLSSKGIYNDKMNYFLNTFSDPKLKESVYSLLLKIEFGYEIKESVSTANSVYNTYKKISKVGLVGDNRVIYQNKSTNNRFLSSIGQIRAINP